MTANRPVDSLRAFVGTGSRTHEHHHAPGVIVVGAGKGGVGTSVVSALLAVEASRNGERVLLVDADESVASLHLMLGIQDPGPGIGALRGGRILPSELLHTVTPNLWLFPGGGGGVDATLSNAPGERRTLMRRVAGLYESFSTVIVDGGSRVESVMAACGVGAERLVCVTAADRISLAASYALFKGARSRFESLPIELLVNAVGERRGRSVHAIVRAAALSFLATDVRLGGTIPSDDSIVAALESGVPLTELDARSSAPAATASVVHRVLDERADLLSGSVPALPFAPAL